MKEFEHEFRMLGLKIAYYRKAHNPPYTQEQLAELVGTSTSNIGTIESKMYKPISENAVSDCGGAGGLPKGFARFLGPLQNDPKKRARFGARKGFQTSLVAIFLVCEDKE